MEEELLDDPVEEPTEEQPEEPKEETPKEPEKPAEKPDEKKEHNRKGYEIRKGKEAEKQGVSREEFDSLNSKVNSITEENTDLKFRNAHSEITDEEFNSIKAHAKGTGKSYEETLKDPIFQKYFEDKDTKGRVDRATTSPSTRTGAGESKPDFPNMSSQDFASYKQKVLVRRSG